MAAARSAEAKLGLSREGNANRFVAPVAVAPTMPATVSLNNLHAFSYLGTEVSIMRRVANESALVADGFAAALADEAAQP